MVSVLILGRAMASPVVDSLMIIEMKKDKEYGSQDIRTFGQICLALGAIFFGILGGYTIVHSHDHKIGSQ